MLPQEAIRRKRDGAALPRDEVRDFITGLNSSAVSEGHRAAFGRLLPGIVVHPLSFPTTGSLPEFAAAIEGLRRIIRPGAYDCVDGHNRNGSIVARMAAWLEAVPINLYTAHGFYFHDDQSPLAREATIALEAVLARVTAFTFSQSTEDAERMVRRRLITEEKISIIGNGIETTRVTPHTAAGAPTISSAGS